MTAVDRPDRVDSTDPRRRIDRSGRPQFIRKSTSSERDRRDVWIAKLWRRGHTTLEIAHALDCARNTVGERLNAMGFDRTKRYVGRGPVVGPCPWRDEDVPAEERSDYVLPTEREPRWRQSRILAQAQMLNDEYRESNFANILANQVTDAEDGGDKDWLLEALATFNAAIEKLERARRILTDDDYRVLCRDTLEGVEQMRTKQVPPSRPSLRSVPGRGMIG